MEKITEGPWKVSRYDEKTKNLYLDGNVEWWLVHTDDEDEAFICHLDREAGIEEEEEIENNARLIAAAPDMLEALVKISNIREPSSDNPLEEAQDIAKTVLTKLGITV